MGLVGSNPTLATNCFNNFYIFLSKKIALVQNFLYLCVLIKNKNMKIIQEEIKSCFSIADVCRFVGWVPSGDNYRRAKELIKDLDTSHFRKGPWNKGKKVRLKNQTTSLKELLVKNSPHKNTYKLKNRLFKAGLKEEKCEVCEYTESLELHHINGDPTDNRLENLQILCPNCHAKTINYRGKNSSISKRRHETPESLYLTDAEVVARHEENLIKRRERSREKYKEEHPNYTPRIIEIIECPVCGKEFRKTSKRIKYCSQDCCKIAQAQESKRPSFLELIQSLKTYKNFVQTANFYGVTDNAVRKWCKLYQIPIYTKEMQEFVNKL